ncbi:MAG: hypothetical protein ABJA79_01205 [Parafilimonas sp.]
MKNILFYRKPQYECGKRRRYNFLSADMLGNFHFVIGTNIASQS